MKNFQNKEQIIKISNVIRHVLFAGLVLWIGVGIPIILAQAVNSRDVFGCMAKLYLHGGAILFLILSFLVNLMLFRFFDLLKKGNLFDAQTVRHLDSAGKWWITFWVFEVFYYEIGRYCGIGCGILQISDVWNFGNLFAGLVLILVAWLLREAQGLEEE